MAKLLVVDNEQKMCKIIKAGMELEGHQVQMAFSGADALDMLRGQPVPDLVVTDLRMGSEPYYVFRFKVAEAGNPHPLPVEDEQLRTRLDRDQLAWVWRRIWGPLPAIGFWRALLRRRNNMPRHGCSNFWSLQPFVWRRRVPIAVFAADASGSFWITSSS